MRKRIRREPGLVALLSLTLMAFVLAVPQTARAGTKTWNTTAGDWANDGNWVGGHPVAGDDAIITNAGAAVLLTSSTVYINSLTNSQTLIFSNWNTTLSAINATILSGGTVTVTSAFTTNAGVMSNNVYIVCSNLTVAAGGKIIADGKGYAGGAVGANGYGPGAGKSTGANPACGGGYGGFSANASSPGSLPYGSASTPFQPGSGGGGGNNNAGSAGGGAIRIEAAGFVTNNGTISANGVNGGTSSYGSGGGSGGGIYIQCYTFGGAGGVVSANGGDGPAAYSTPGGGGRIALNFNSGAQSAVPAVSLTALPGRMGTVYYGDIGTIYFSNTNLLSTTLSYCGQLIISNLNAWSVNNLTVTNAWVRFPNDGFVLNVASDLTVGTNGNFGIGGSTPIPAADIALSCTTSPPIMQVGGNLILMNGGCLSVYSAMTNAGPGTTNYGALVSVTGNVVVSSGSWIYPQSHPTNGGSPYFQMNSLSIATNAGVNADGRGFAGGKLSADNGYGPGRAVGGNWSSGAGYGGFGGSCYDSYQNRGLVYGSATAPVDPGSGSGGGTSAGLGGAGGGSVWMNVRNGVLLNGTLTANGVRAGSGGGIYITCNTFVGTNGLVSAEGGAARNTTYAGSGGGGRIAIVYTNTAAQNTLPVPGVKYTVTSAMTAGVTARGDIGTLYFPDQYFLTANLTNMNGQIFGVTSWSPGSLLLSNNWVRFSADGIRLSVTNDVRVEGALGLLEIGGSFVLSNNIVWIPPSPLTFVSYPVLCSTSPPILTVGGNLTLTNGGSLGVYCAPTNLGAGTTNYGGLVTVAKDMVIGTNSWVYPQSHPTNGGSVTFVVNNLFMADSSNAGFNACGRGYSGAFNSRIGFGPGAGGPASGSGGGYGGYGGGSYYRTYGGATYGSSNTPVDPGSGGWAYQAAGGGNGGGSIRIIANRTLAANGSFLANTPNDGSGGGIYITCRTFTGTTNGFLNAKGGDSGSTLQGAGGGGRIAVWRVQESPPYLGSWTVTNGFGYASSGSPAWSNGVPGTIVWGLLPAPGTVFSGR